MTEDLFGVRGLIGSDDEEDVPAAVPVQAVVGDRVSVEPELDQVIAEAAGARRVAELAYCHVEVEPGIGNRNVLIGSPEHAATVPVFARQAPRFRGRSAVVSGNGACGVQTVLRSVDDGPPHPRGLCSGAHHSLLAGISGRQRGTVPRSAS